MNVIGEPIDECGPIGTSLHCCIAKILISFQTNFACYSQTLETSSSLAIHREAPPFVDQSTEMEMLVTGIKVHNAEFL